MLQFVCSFAWVLSSKFTFRALKSLTFLWYLLTRWDIDLFLKLLLSLILLIVCFIFLSMHQFHWSFIQIRYLFSVFQFLPGTLWSTNSRNRWALRVLRLVFQNHLFSQFFASFSIKKFLSSVFESLPID